MSVAHFGATARASETSASIQLIDIIVSGVRDTPQSAVSLGQNHPNPFNPFTTIPFSIPSRAPVRVAVYDAAGRLVAALLNETLEVGSHSVTWQGTNLRGDRVASGIYFYKLSVDGQSLTRKMTLLK